MTYIEDKLYKGTVKTFNGQFGFIKSELGDTYFHKSGIVGMTIIDKGDEVEFKVEPSVRKLGSSQGFDIALIGKATSPIITLSKPIIGALKWFNEEKGYGIIGTPENTDYFLYKSNLLIENHKLVTGVILIFEEKIAKGKKAAIHCKVANEYEDLKLAFDYLSKKDNVIVEEKGRRGNKQVSILKQGAFQILKDKEIDNKLKFIMDYFQDKLSNKSSEEQLRFFNFVKNIFENNFKNDSISFLTSFFSQHSEFLITHIDLRYLLWLKGYIQEKDLYYISQEIIKESGYQLPNIFEKLIEPNEQETVLNKFLEIIGNIDIEEKYSRIKTIANLKELDEEVKKLFLNSVYSQSDIERRYRMWLEGYTQEKDLSYIAKQISKESIGSYQNPLRKIFETLTNPNEQETVLKEFLEIIGNIDSEEKYSRIKSLSGILKLDDKVKERFQFKVFNESNIHYRVERFLNYLQFTEGDKHQLIINLFNKLDITSFYLFCLELLNPLAKINTHYYHQGYSYLKIYLEKKDYIHETNNKYENSSIFSYKGILLNEIHFETKIAFFKTILSYIEDNLNAIEISTKAIIETSDFNLISKFLKTFHSYNSTQIQICSDLQIKESNIPNVETYIVDMCDTPQLLKFWVYNLIEYFNFNTYCYYYFTLTLEERKVFNKKAKAKMGEAIKTAMLKKREPWKLVEKVIIKLHQKFKCLHFEK